MKTLLLSLTYLVGIGELILAIYFWVTNSRSEIRRVMALLAFSTGMWVLLSALTSFVEFSITGYYETALLYVFAMILVTSIFHLVLIFPFPLIQLDKFHKILFYFPIVFFAYALFFSRTIVITFTGNSLHEGSLIGGPLFNLYNGYLALLFILSVFILIHRIKKLSGIHRSNTIILFWSFVVGGVPGTILYLLLPIINGELSFNTVIGTIPTIFWVLGIWYVIDKNKT